MTKHFSTTSATIQPTAPWHVLHDSTNGMVLHEANSQLMPAPYSRQLFNQWHSATSQIIIPAIVQHSATSQTSVFWNNWGKVTTAVQDPDCKLPPLTHKKKDCLLICGSIKCFGGLMLIIDIRQMSTAVKYLTSLGKYVWLCYHG